MHLKSRDRLLRAALFARPAFLSAWRKTRSPEWLHRSLEEKLDFCLSLMAIPQTRVEMPSIDFVSILDPSIPEEIRQCDPPPLGLFIRGAWPLASKRLAVVGSRKPLPYSLRVTRSCIREWVRADFQIVSGGAYGIDAEAHRATLEYGGRTVVVMGSGFHHLYPSAHARLFDEILKHSGTWISEYAPSVEAQARYFPERNRIIAGLCQALFLAQAHLKSGSMITAKRALDMGREIFVLRPPPGDENFDGSQSLLDAGALPISSSEVFRHWLHPDRPLETSPI